MLKKLLKHEFRATARIFAPLFGVAAALAGVTLSIVRLGGLLVLPGGTGIGGPLLGVLCAVLLLLSILALFALMVSVMLVTVQRFYKNLLGDEGYLMFALPVTPGQHIAAKLITSVVWTVGALALVLGVLLALVLSIPGAPDNGLTLSALSLSFEREMGVSPAAFFALFCPFFILGTANGYLLAYLSMAIGSQRQEARLAASFAAFAVLNAVLMVLYVVGIFFFAGITSALGLVRPLQDFFNSQPPLVGMGAILGVASCVMLAFSAVYFLATRKILTKQLNLA